MTQIEEFLYQNLQLSDAAPFLQAFSFCDDFVSLELISFPNRTSKLKATFANAVIYSLWFDSDETLNWPLDMLGFEADQAGDCWKFVLYCGQVEWIWHSKWPVVSGLENLEATI